MEQDPATWSSGRAYHFLTHAVVPRPIAWITTLDPESGVVNAAPFSWFQAVCADPPMVMVSIGDRAPPKDTLRNIGSTGEFVVNVAPAALANEVVATSVEVPPDRSEVELVDLETCPSHTVAPPRLAASPLHLECRLHGAQHYGHAGRGATVVVGQVVWAAGDDRALDARGNLDVRAAPLLARLGGRDYQKTEGFFSLERPAGHDKRPEGK